MKQRRIYYRRKGKSIVIEGKQGKKNILIWTLPRDPEKLLEIVRKASNFPIEKMVKIDIKIKGLDIRKEQGRKSSQ